MRLLIILKLLFYFVAFEYEQPVGWRIQQSSIPILKSVKISFFIFAPFTLCVQYLYFPYKKVITSCF